MKEADDARCASDGAAERLAAIEALLFVAAAPLELDEIAAALGGIDRATLEAALEALGRELDRPGRGLKLERVAGGHRLVTRPELAEQVRALFRFRNQKRLTPAALDVLAIVAYAQPITAPEIHEIRGTDPDYALHVLLDRRLIRVVGRRRVVGRPMLFGTTREFLLHFGLDSLEDLPDVGGFDTRVAPTQARLFPVAAPAAPVDEPDGGATPFDAEDEQEWTDRESVAGLAAAPARQD